MAKNCIICGKRAGSREHVFPAALGGRRTNKGIYCGAHNEAYSGLASVIKEQLAIFNAQLGVVGDHTDEPTSVTMTDIVSGQEIELRRSQVRFKGPPRMSEAVVNGQKVKRVTFSSQKQVDDWMREQKSRGLSPQVVGQPTRRRYHPGTAHLELRLGGLEGMRAIGYIAQTFLAHYFPDIARLPALGAFKDYTLRDVGSGLVWWDFEPPDDLPSNKFDFGHRVVVGHNAADASVYARVSLFSALNFAALFGMVPTDVSRAVITDIDPLAASPPDDVFTWTEDSAKSAVSKPEHLIASLASAIESGKAQHCLSDLLRRISVFDQRTAASAVLAKIADAAAMRQPDRQKLFAEIVSAQSQRVFRLIWGAAEDCKRRAITREEQAIADLLERAIALDPQSANGLTDQATQALAAACAAIAKRMQDEFETGQLDFDRVLMLIGDGPGMYEVVRAIVDTVAANVPAAASK